MQTRLDLPNNLYKQIKRLAKEKGISITQVILEGLQLLLASQNTSRTMNKNQDFSFGKGGFADAFEEGSWDKIRDAIYQGRGA